jgi:hypothetical protein
LTADVINLRRARKTKARVEQDKKSAENRAYFGRSKAEKERTDQARERIRRELDQARITTTKTDDEGVSS